MKTFSFRMAIFYVLMAAITSTMILGINVAFSVDYPSANPPGSSLKPTFNGMTLNIGGEYGTDKILVGGAEVNWVDPATIEGLGKDDDWNIIDPSIGSDYLEANYGRVEIGDSDNGWLNVDGWINTDSVTAFGGLPGSGFPPGYFSYNGGWGNGVEGAALALESTGSGNVSTVLEFLSKGTKPFDIGLYSSGASPSAKVYFNQRNNAPMSFFTNDTERMTISGGGDVQVSGGLSADTLISNSSITGLLMSSKYFGGSGDAYIEGNADVGGILEVGGKLGVNKTPSYTLDVNGSINGSDLISQDDLIANGDGFIGAGLTVMRDMSVVGSASIGDNLTLRTNGSNEYGRINNIKLGQTPGDQLEYIGNLNFVDLKPTSVSLSQGYGHSGASSQGSGYNPWKCGSSIEGRMYYNDEYHRVMFCRENSNGTYEWHFLD